MTGGASGIEDIMHSLVSGCSGCESTYNRISNVQPTRFSLSVIGSLLVMGCLIQPTSAQEGTSTDKWPLCPGDFSIPPRPAFDTSLDPEEVEINADDADITEGGIADFWGNVIVTGKDQAARADHMRYYQSRERGELEGNVELWDEQLYMTSDTGNVELDEDHGTFYNAHYWLPINHGRGEGDSVYHEFKKLTVGETVDYTTCPTSSEVWKISARKLRLNHEEEWGSARDVVLRIRDVPVFYTPYASFPLSDKRKSGFLPPSFGSGSRTGAELITPYYWNIAPEMDATISPRFMADRGIMLMGEYRYLFEDGRGEIDGEFLPSDGGSNLGSRGIFGINHYQRYANNHGVLDIDYAHASDKFYLEDFGTSLENASTSYLLKRGYTSYSGSWWYASANLQTYQIVDSNITTEPYKRLPQLRFGTNFLPESWSPHFDLDTEAVYFTRDEINTAFVTDVNGTRYDFMPSVSYPMRWLGGYIEPKVGMRFTQYDLHGNDVMAGPNTFDDNPSRTLPFASIDSGLFFERDFNFFGRGNYQQTLEPRLFYLYVPDEDQSDLPIFDTNFYDVSFAQLFRENRFSSADRFGDANQITFAVTSRILDLDRGRELGRFSVGQVYYFDDRDVTLPGFRPNTEDMSPIVAEVATTIIPNWEAVGTIHWDPNDTRTEKLAARISYNDGEGRVLNLAYRMRRDPRSEFRINQAAAINRINLVSVEQTDLSFHWPINPEWSVVGRWNYALPESKTLEIFGGVQYDSCCWAMRLVARRFINATTILTNNRDGADDEFSTGIFLQFEMKGLTGLGRGTGEFLKRSIRGFDPDQF